MNATLMTLMSWMSIDEIFTWVARASLYAVAVIAGIVLVQALTRRALAAKWVCALWIILLLRLVIPAGPESGWSLWNLAPPQLMSQMFSYFGITSNQEINPAVDYVISVGITAPAPSTPSTAGNGDFSLLRALQTFLPGIWLAGALSVMCGIIIGNLRLWNTIRRLHFVTDHALMKLFEECRQSMQIQTLVGLIVTDRVKSPILFGFIRPRVLLPADLVRELPFERLRYILLHELAHLKRRDILTGWILAFLQSLHWFNPLVWWAFGRMRFDRELACDEQVLSRVPDEERRNYGDVLIGMLERYNNIHHLPAIAGILENKNHLKRRLVMIKKFRRPERREIVAFAALLAVLSITFLTEPRSLLSQSNEQSSGNQAVNEVRVGEFRIFAQDAVTDTDYARLVVEDDMGRKSIAFFPVQDSTVTNGQSSGDQTVNPVLIGEFKMVLSPMDAEMERGAGQIQIITRSGSNGSAVWNAQNAVTDSNGAMIVVTEQSSDALTVKAVPVSKIAMNIVENAVNDLNGTMNGNEQSPRAVKAVSVGEFRVSDAIGGTTERINGGTPGEYRMLLNPPYELDEQGIAVPSRVEAIQRMLPILLERQIPDYTQEARDARIDGVVVISAVIGKDGSVVSAEVIRGRGLGYGLDEAAIDAVMKWRFSPATGEDGMPQDFPAIIEVSFKLF